MANRFLNIDEIVSEAASLVKGASAEERLWFKQWAWRGLRDIGPMSDNIDVVTLYPENLVFRKPNDFYKAIDIALFDGRGNEFKTKYRSGKHRIHNSRNIFIKDGIYNSDFDGTIDISEDAHFFYLGTNGRDVTYAQLRYFKLPVDSDNNPIFPEYMAKAITMYILWYWEIREDGNDQGAEDRYLRARSEARAQGKVPNGLLYKQIAKEWNSMIQYYNPDRF